jgi:hypothetical protein
VISLVCVLNIIFIKDKPPTPPSITAEIKKSSFVEGIGILIKDPNYILLFLSFGFG